MNKIHMLSKASAACALFAATAIPQASMAGDLSSISSSGSVTFTVIIPPFAASLRAASQGAIGLWSIAGANDGLLLKLDTNEAGGSVLSLYRREGIGAEISISNPGSAADASAPDTAGTADLVGSANDGGLVNDTYNLDGLTAGVNTVTIAAI